jgi:hypothetical protein
MKKREYVEILTPQFERSPNAPKPSPAPADLAAWRALRTLSIKELKAMGLRQWSDADAVGSALMLFPGEWYGSIPEGFQITNIFGASAPFIRGTTNSDIRFGLLSYGIVTTPKRSRR